MGCARNTKMNDQLTIDYSVQAKEQTLWDLVRLRTPFKLQPLQKKSRTPLMTSELHKRKCQNKLFLYNPIQPLAIHSHSPYPTLIKGDFYFLLKLWFTHFICWVLNFALKTSWMQHRWVAVYWIICISTNYFSFTSKFLKKSDDFGILWDLSGDFGI